MHSNQVEVNPVEPTEASVQQETLPAFEARPDYPYGVLPDGVHQCSEITFIAGFNEGFPDSTTRTRISSGFLRLRNRLTELGVSATQWVDGSFVETKLNPGDVDVVSFCDYDFVNQHVHRVPEAVQLLDGAELTKPQFDTHTFLVPSCVPGHPFFEVFEQERNYWRKWFGTTRPISIRRGMDGIGHVKGFVQMELGSNAPAILTERRF